MGLHFFIFVSVFTLSVSVFASGNTSDAESDEKNTETEEIEIIYPDNYDPETASLKEKKDSPESKEKESEKSVKKEFFPVEGVVREKGTRKPLKNISFYVVNMEKTIRTDRDGKFSFKAPPGQHTVVIPLTGYEKLETVIQVFKNEKLSLVFRLEPDTVNPYTIVVREKRKKGEVSAKRVTIEEASKIPGTNRDVLRSITNLPGVNNFSVFNGYGSGLIIRGSPPEDSLRRINSHNVPMLYHFGGLDSVIEPEFVESIDYYAGGFGSDYYNATGGVVQLNLREPDSEIWGGYINLNFLSSSAMIEGPLSEKTNMAVSFKRGFLDLYVMLLENITEIKDFVDFSAYPSYYDINTAFTHRFSHNSKLNIYSFWSIDDVTLTFDEQSETQKFDNSFNNKTAFFSLLSEWKYRKGDFSSVFSPGIEGTVLKMDLGNNAYLENTFMNFVMDEKMSYKVNSEHTFKWGFRFMNGFYGLDINLFAPPKEGEVGYNPFANEMQDKSSGYFWYPGFFIKDVITSGNMIITPGITAIYDPHNKKFMSDPRISLKYNIGKKWTLKAATGLYSKVPSNDESYEPWGTPGLKPEKSFHGIAGVEYRPLENLEIDLQVWYKSFFDLIVRTDYQKPSVYENQGKGYAYGTEIFIRRKLTEKFFGWLSYSWGVSRRLDVLGPQGGEAQWRPFDMDINHNLKIIASYKFNKNWQIGARFSLTSGLPYTNLMNTDYTYDVDNDIVIPNYSGPVNRDRLPAQHQLDIRLDRYWIFNNWILSTYLDIQNIYLRRNVIGIAYNADYTEERNISLFPILVFVGIKGDF